MLFTDRLLSRSSAHSVSYFQCQAESLTLERNSFSGTIPSEWENLWNLVAFSVQENSITGNMPEDLCYYKDLDDLKSDCIEEVSCWCCTECFKDSASAQQSDTPPPPPTDPESSLIEGGVIGPAGADELAPTDDSVTTDDPSATQVPTEDEAGP